MELYEIVLESGRVLKAGAREESAIAQVQLTGSVNPDRELTPGGVCSTMLEVTVIDPKNQLEIGAGSRLVLRKENRQAGVFYAEKPERTAAGQYRITAYDAVSRLDQDLGQWLFALSGWPYTLQAFARLVCEKCGLVLTNSLPINGTYPVGAFSGAGITGRQLMRWICQLGGCFCRANPEGKLEFAWYRETGLCLRPTGADFYYSGGLTGGEYATYPIEKVQLSGETVYRETYLTLLRDRKYVGAVGEFLEFMRENDTVS